MVKIRDQRSLSCPGPRHTSSTSAPASSSAAESPSQIHTTYLVNPDSVRGVKVVGQRVDVSLADDRKSISVDTSGLPDRDVLAAHRRAPQPQGRTPRGLSGPLLDHRHHGTDPIDEVVIQHAVRVQVGELGSQRLPFDGKADGDYVDVFKVEDRATGVASEIAFAANGRRVDYQELLAEQAKRQLETYGRMHPTLHATVERAKARELIRVAVWLHAPEAKPFDKPAKGAIRKEPAQAAENRRYWESLTTRFAEEAKQLRLEVVGVETRRTRRVRRRARRCHP